MMTKLISTILVVLASVGGFAQPLCSGTLAVTSSNPLPRRVVLTYLSARAATLGENEKLANKNFYITQNYMKYASLHNEEALGLLIDLIFDKNMDVEIQRQALTVITNNNDIFRDSSYLNISDENKQKIIRILSKKVNTLIASYKSDQSPNEVTLQYNSLARWALLSYKTNPDSLDDIMDRVMIEINESMRRDRNSMERLDILFKAFTNFVDFAQFKPDSRFWQKDIPAVINKMNWAFDDKRFIRESNKMAIVSVSYFILEKICKSSSHAEMGMIKNNSSLRPILSDLFKMVDQSLHDLKQSFLPDIQVEFVVPYQKKIQTLKQALGVEAFTNYIP